MWTDGTPFASLKRVVNRLISIFISGVIVGLFLSRPLFAAELPQAKLRPYVIIASNHSSDVRRIQDRLPHGETIVFQSIEDFEIELRKRTDVNIAAVFVGAFTRKGAMFRNYIKNSPNDSAGSSALTEIPNQEYLSHNDRWSIIDSRNYAKATALLPDIELIDVPQKMLNTARRWEISKEKIFFYTRESDVTLLNSLEINSSKIHVMSDNEQDFGQWIQSAQETHSCAATLAAAASPSAPKRTLVIVNMGIPSP